ncbi:fumarate reductase flavoprotein subunit [Hyphomonas johnsonii MHS-2]|uniref:Fumarate reductase flavoprotein subunit n=1 Tax=Hyphomonas johnsonii MHS-2 TaxID=1280950 RepID=A0A059FFZ3_9PROT|nr:fumarate reductase flavoprotein subunit [Hyphomonas johnsonii MHS-2]
MPVVVIGAGACGLCAALAAHDSGADVLVLEQDKTPLGTTAMSTGLIPAAGTPEQRDAGIEDSPEIFARDILAKHGGQTDASVVDVLAATSAETIRWLRDSHALPLSLVEGFTYPGHSHRRMYGTPNRSGTELMAGLQRAVVEAGIDILTQAKVISLICDATRTVRGVRIMRPGGTIEEIGCDALVLASSGFAGSREMVAHFIPAMATAVIHSHPGNQGDAIKWGEALGASLADMGAYQGHGGLAVDHGVPILWPLIMEGGIQVNRLGRRFSDESKGYSEQAETILSQPDGVAWSIFDQTLYDMMLQFTDFSDAVSAGAIKSAGTPEQLAEVLGLPAGALVATLLEDQDLKSGRLEDEFGRDFRGRHVLRAPYYAAKVTGALFHTQGGLCVDSDARVLDTTGCPFPNLFAGGGAARGISGGGSSGYIAGNGLLTATSLGKIAGRAAARHVAEGV